MSKIEDYTEYTILNNLKEDGNWNTQIFSNKPNSLPRTIKELLYEQSRASIKLAEETYKKSIEVKIKLYED